MNKKHLSVVMAGAMLATSVAPVLAADAVTVKEEKLAYNQRGLAMDMFRTVASAPENTFKIGSDKVKKGESVFGIKKGENITYNVNESVKAIKDATPGSKLEIYKHRSVKDENGNLSAKSLKATEAVMIEDKIEDKAELNKFFTDNFNADGTAKVATDFLNKAELNKEGTVLTITLNKKAADLVTDTTIELKVGDTKLDFSKPLDSDNLLITDGNAQNLVKFDVVMIADPTQPPVEADKDLGEDLVAVVELTVDSTNNDSNYFVEELFDGLLLTEKGQELFDKVKYDVTGEGIDYTVGDVTTKYGVSSFEIKCYNNKTEKTDVITVRGLNESDAIVLKNWLQSKYEEVDVLAGSNRYETAVKIAKEQANLKEVAKGGHVVLVNGNALVDGLAAAPFAASLNKENSAAPILLTDSDKLPKATRAYLQELVSEIKVGKLNKVEIDLVGGDAVLSESLVEELKEFGFEVRRFGGDNREATSLEVAKAMGKNASEVFVVGANGEADAMSIAPVASREGAPIIVASNNGLSKLALKDIEYLKANDVTIVGGEGVVSKADEAKLVELKGEDNVERVAGSNRQATNAKIIENYYENFKSEAVVVAKDGQANKDELVDALTAANLASQKNAPIVLATNKLSDAQINQVNLKAAKARAVYQVGFGVERTVLAKIASLLELPSR